jgi:translocation and assembly module TamA
MLLAGVSLISASAALAQDIPPIDEPIVPDAEFQAQLPDLDPALDTPLVPIVSFDVEPAAPGTEGEIIPDAPVDDPALAEPLPPIATFDVTPPAEMAAEAAEEAAPVRYSIVLEGLDEVDLAGRFRDISALEEGDGRATNGAMIAARAREDEELVVRLLRSEGYYDASAISTVEQLPDQPGRLRVVITAAPGQRYSFGSITVTGPETVPPGLAREALPLQSGQPIVAPLVAAAEGAVILRLPEQGYPFATIGQRDILLDPETQLGDYTLPVDPGPRARFGGFVTEGDLAFDAEHVEVLARFERDELYDRRLVDDLREAMVATSLFASVSAEPVLTGETAPDGTQYVNVLVRQDAGPPRSLTASAGYGTGEGFKLEGAWEHRNLFVPEGALRAGVVAGTQEQSANVRFRRSNAGSRDRTVLLQLEAGRRDYEAFEGYTARLYGLISRDSTPIWQKRWTWAYGAEIIATNENRFSTVRFERERNTYFIGGLIGQLGYDTTDNLLNPTEGFRLLGRTNPEISFGQGTNPYYRNLIEGSAYYPVSDSLVVAGRARIGSIYGIDRDDLAPSRRFYAGGGGSVRGFGYQELGPRDPENVPIGGRSLNEFALEGRYRFGDYGIVGFIDAGQVYETEYPDLSNLRYGIGVGGRLYTNFGPLRLDVAMPLDRQPGESRFSVYISIGQAF